MIRPRSARPILHRPQPAPIASAAARWLAPGVMLAMRARVRNAITLLVGLLLFTVVGRLVDPVFTSYWGYLAGQIAILALVIVAFECRCPGRALLSPSTYAIVSLAMTVDVLGTAGHMYERVDFYDKIVHLMGTGALTAVVHDVFEYRGWGRKLRRPNALAAIAVVIGMLVGGIWELYEMFGDVIFATARSGGAKDTTYDVLFDSIGAVSAAIVLTWRLGEAGAGARTLPADPAGSQVSSAELARGGR